MDALHLDPGDYTGSYKLVGGRLSLDLVNTVSWPGSERAHDWLDSPDNLNSWARAVGLPAFRAKPADVQAIVALRGELDAALRPLAGDSKPSRRALDRLNTRIQRAALRRVIDAGTLAWKWRPADTVIDAFAPVILDAAELVTAGDHQRLRHCPACNWLFEDRTRNGQRRWCDMADCGSRDKARRYYRRTLE